MSKNKNKNNKGTTMAAEEVTNTPESETVETTEETENPEVADETVEENTTDTISDTLSDSEEIITKEYTPIFVCPQTEDADIILLYELLNDYVENILLGGGVNRTQENIIKFIKIGQLISRRNRKVLVSIFFKELIQGPRNYLMAPDLVFQFINKIHDENAIKIEVLYTSLMGLSDFLRSPKAKGFPFDLGRITQQFGGEALSEFIKERI